MGTFLIYLIKSGTCLLLFYLFFKVLLSKETFFRFNRCVLLLGIVICSALPLIQLNLGVSFLQHPFKELENALLSTENKQETSDSSPTLSQLSLEILSISEGSIDKAPSKETKTTLPQILFTGYLIGISVSSILLIISVLKMGIVIRKGRKIKQNKHILILVKENICPFSWWNYIIINENDYKNHSKEILLHEQVHVQQKHTIDILFLEAITLLYWFNPGAWLLKKEIRDIHEYEADSGVLKQGIDATKYQLLLVKKAVGARYHAIANSFNHSKIKNRITMMLKEKSNTQARLKIAVFIPLAAVALQAFAHSKTSVITNEVSDSEVTNFNEKATENPQDSVKLVTSLKIVDIRIDSSSLAKPKGTRKIGSPPRMGMYTDSTSNSPNKSSSPMKTIKPTTVRLEDDSVVIIDRRMDSSEKPLLVIRKDSSKKPPLLIVEGKEVSSADIDKINIEDIESMTVLKDEAAIKIYGERAVNGVILIELKIKSKNENNKSEKKNELYLGQ